VALTEYRYGALYVLHQDSDRRDLDRELKRIDDRLFFEKQVTFDNEEVWCVCIGIGGDQPPWTLLEWRDQRGQPIPYLEGEIITRIARMDRDGARLSERVVEENANQLRARREWSRQQYEEIARDMIPRIYDRKRPVLHRSQALRMSRDKRRAEGENI
jgi:hypothetical protein